MDSVAPTHLIAPPAFAEALGSRLPSTLHPADPATANGRRRLRRALRRGEDLVLIGGDHLDLLAPFWVRSYAVPDGAVNFAAVESGIAVPQPSPGPCRCGYLCPPVKHTWDYEWGTVRHNVYHGIDEEFRGDFLPLVAAHDRLGTLLGYPGFLVKHRFGAYTTNACAGGHWYCWLFDDPLAALSPDAWTALLAAIIERREPRLHIGSLQPEFARYAPGDSVRVLVDVANTGSELQAAHLDLALHGAAGEVATADAALAVGPGQHETLLLRLHLPATAAGWLDLRACLAHEARFEYAADRTRTAVDQDANAVFVRDGAPAGDTPTIGVDRTRLLIDGRDGFHAGMHLYPHNFFADGCWKNLRLDRCRRELAAMRDHGIRLLRLWVDTTLDEETLRGLDAMIELCQEFGIVVILTIWTQWEGTWRIDLPDCRETCELWTRRDYNLSGITFRHMDFQRRFVGILAARYRDVSGLVWNLSNEGAVVDPDAEQLADGDWLDPRYQDLPPPQDVNDLIVQWLEETKAVIRRHGASQPVIATYVWCTANGTTYVTNRPGDIGTQHDYGAELQSVPWTDLAGCDKPLLLEEFGTNLPDHEARARHYESTIHYALGTHTAGAVAYEWGVSYIGDRMSGAEPWLRYPPTLGDDIDPRWFTGMYDKWACGALSVCCYAASWQYGSIYPLTGIPTAAIRHLQRAVAYGADLAFVPAPKRVYLLMVEQWTTAIKPGKGRRRLTAAIDATIARLRRLHVDFAIVQEDRLEGLPDSAEVLVVPVEESLPAGLDERLAGLAERGLTVVRTDGDLPDPALFAPVEIAAANPIDLLTRDLADGILYVLHNRHDQPQAVCLETAAGRVALTIERFGLVGVGAAGVFLVEAAGPVSIADQTVIAAAEAPFVLYCPADRDLTTAPSLDLLSLRPGRLTAPAVVRAEYLPLTGDEAGSETSVAAGHLDLDPAATRARVRLTTRWGTA